MVNRCFTNNKGAILLMVLIVILTISLLGTALFALFFNVLVTSRVELYRAQALYLAEAGLAKAVNTLKTQAGQGAGALQVVFTDTPQPLPIVPRTELGEGFFEAYSDLSESMLVSYGTSHGVTRAIQMKYSAF
ncbi:MAG: hypothetical protein QME65_05665 [Candidatus Omnitrophota bacterium]|nr:hypothetical protein [Candidatus Omnitrophota bacterium]